MTKADFVASVCDILNNEGYFYQTVTTEVTKKLKDNNITNTGNDRRFICNNIIKEYLNQYNEFISKY